jgi:hypothetical protein
MPPLKISFLGNFSRIAASGQRAQPNLLYGAGSGAVSFTVTPTYTLGHFFVRADASIVDITDLKMGDGFGSSG